jgi:hypothetical protein
MSGKDNHDSIARKGDSKLKNPGRRQVLGVAVVAAAFTAEQVGSAEAAGPRREKHGREKHGGLVKPHDLPGVRALSYGPVSTFHDLAAQLVYKDAANYRQMVSAYAKSLRQKMNLPAGEFRHVVRLEPIRRTAAAAGYGAGDDQCGCCCC